MTPTLTEYAPHWLRAARLRLKHHTLRNYEQALRLHILPVLGDYRLDALDRAAVHDWLVELRAAGQSAGSARLYLAALRSMLRTAEDRRVIPTNPADHQVRLVPIRKGPCRQDVMSAAQVEIFLSAMARDKPQLFPLFLCLARTGLRLGEARGLRWEDCDFGRRLIHVRRSAPAEESCKTEEEGTVGMSPALKDALLHLPQRSEWVFASPRGTPWAPRYLGMTMHAVVRRAGMTGHYTPHSLRHSFGTTLCLRGQPLPVVQKALRHRTPSMTLFYARHVPDVALDVFDSLDRGE